MLVVEEAVGNYGIVVFNGTEGECLDYILKQCNKAETEAFNDRSIGTAELNDIFSLTSSSYTVVEGV